jgi:hypothetical protein
MVERVGLSAEAAEARTLFDCHIWPGCIRKVRLELSGRDEGSPDGREPSLALSMSCATVELGQCLSLA